MNITQIHEVGLRFAIYYSKSHWKRNNFLIVISCINVKIKGLELMSKIIIYLKRRKKKDRRVLTRYPQIKIKATWTRGRVLSNLKRLMHKIFF
jgi:hypothetical protein